jgi:uncharacterized Fe-S center protein
MNLTDEQENALADAWMKSIKEFLPKLAEYNNTSLEKEEQKNSLDQFF